MSGLMCPWLKPLPMWMSERWSIFTMDFFGGLNGLGGAIATQYVCPSSVRQGLILM
ncbi:MAG: hypothetical protein F6K11_31005 [Leptolyngbya sp. SIO3F4]|nr:hypothetical protein [Leptolyngbya sp. SIO3F4]